MSGKKPLVSTLLMAVLLLSGCPGEETEENDEEEGNGVEEAEEILEDLLEIEENLISVMQQADLVPLVEGMPPPEEEEEETDEEEDEAGEEEDDRQNGEDEEDEQVYSETTMEKEILEKTVMGELIRREKEGFQEEDADEKEGLEPPEDTEEIWEEITVSTTELHNLWDAIRPDLVEEEVAPDKLEEFEERLDGLTLSGVEENYFGILGEANHLTALLTEIISTTVDSTTGAAREIKYHTRSVVLASVDGNTEEALARIDFMSELKEGLEDDLEDEEDGILEEFEESLEDLSRVVEKEELEVIKIKAAELMENIVEIIEEVEPEEGEEE